MMDIVLYLFIAILLLVFVFKDYEKHKKSNWIQITLIGIAILNVGIVVFDEAPNAIEKSNWVYVMNDNGINLYNMGDGDNYSEHNLIESMNFSELTPYFSYEGKKISLRSKTIRRMKIKAKVSFKTEEGVDFLVLKAFNLNGLVKDYQPIHEKNPELLKQMIVISGESAFDTFVSKLKES